MKLGQYVRLNTSKITPAAFPHETFDYYSIPAFDLSGSAESALGAEIESQKTILSEPAVLVSKLNPRKMRVQKYVGESKNRAVASTEFMIYQLKPDSDILIEFLAHLLGGDKFARRLQCTAAGTTNSHMRAEPQETLDWSIRVPAVDEQRRTVEILDTIDASIRTTERVIAKLRDTEIAMLLGNIEFGHDEAKLDDVCGLLQDGTHLPPSRTPSGPLLLSVQNLDNGLLQQTSRDTHVSEEFWLGTRRVLPIEPGDVCLAVVGTLGKSGVVPPDLPKFTVQRSLTVLRANPMIMRNDYLFALTRHSEFQRRLWQRANQTAQPGVYLGELRAMSIPCPSLDDQQRVCGAISAVAECRASEEATRAKLEQLRIGVAADLLSGRISTVDV